MRMMSLEGLGWKTPIIKHRGETSKVLLRSILRGLEGFISMLYKLCFNSYDQKCPNVICWVSIYMTKLLNRISFDQIPLWDFLIVGGFPSDFCPKDTGSSYRLHSTGNLENHPIGRDSVMFLRLCHTQGYTLSATILVKLKSTKRNQQKDREFWIVFTWQLKRSYICFRFFPKHTWS